MLQTAKVGRAPVDLAARFALDGSRITIENLGGQPIRFAPAAAAGEAAPADLRAGFLLEPGKRETLRPAGGATFPLWVWGDGEVGIAPAIGPETGGGGGGLSLLFAGDQVDGELSGAHLLGATVLTVLDASIFRLGAVQVGGEVHTIGSIDEAARTVTIEAPGLVAAKLDGTQVVQAPILGGDDVLQLPAPVGGEYAEIDVRFLYDLPQLNGNPAFYNGRSTGAYYSAAGLRSAWFETLANFGSWYANGQVAEDPTGTWSVGLIHATGNAANTWSLEFDPVTHQLSLVALSTVGFIPRIYGLIVAGR